MSRKLPRPHAPLFHEIEHFMIENRPFRSSGVVLASRSTLLEDTFLRADRQGNQVWFFLQTEKTEAGLPGYSLQFLAEPAARHWFNDAPRRLPIEEAARFFTRKDLR